MNDTTKPEKAQKKVRRRVAKSLRAAFIRGQVTTEQVCQSTSRGPRTIENWIEGVNLPPSTVIKKIELLLLLTR